VVSKDPRHLQTESKEGRCLAVRLCVLEIAFWLRFVVFSFRANALSEFVLSIRHCPSGARDVGCQPCSRVQFRSLASYATRWPSTCKKVKRKLEQRLMPSSSQPATSSHFRMWSKRSVVSKDLRHLQTLSGVLEIASWLRFVVFSFRANALPKFVLSMRHCPSGARDVGCQPCSRVQF